MPVKPKLGVTPDTTQKQKKAAKATVGASETSQVQPPAPPPVASGATPDTTTITVLSYFQAACIGGLLANPQFNNHDAVATGLDIAQQLYDSQADFPPYHACDFLAFGVLSNPQTQPPNAAAMVLKVMKEAEEAMNPTVIHL